MFIHERFGTTDSGIHYCEFWTIKTAPALVLVMGYAGSMNTWPRPFLEKLAQTYRLLILDNRGTGKSVKLKDPKLYTVKGMSDDLASVVKQTGMSEFHLLGYSLGGCIALEYAATHPAHVKSLILMSSTAGSTLYSSPPPEMLHALENPNGKTLWEVYLSTWHLCLSAESIKKQNPTLRAIFENSKEHLTPRSALSGHMFAYRSFDGVPHLKKLSMPVLVVTGDADRIAPKANSELLAQKIPGAKLKVIPGCEHAPHIEAEETLLQEILSFSKL